MWVWCWMAVAVAGSWNEWSYWPVTREVEVREQTEELVLPYGWAPENYTLLDEAGRDLLLDELPVMLSTADALKQRVRRVRQRARQHRRSLERWRRPHFDAAVEDLLLGFVALEVEAAWRAGDAVALDDIRDVQLGSGRRLRLAQRSLVELGRPLIAQYR